MLVLTRRGGESVRIGDDITVTVLEDRGRQVRIGIHAPNDVPVHREEVYERIRDGHEAGRRISPQPRSEAWNCPVARIHRGFPTLSFHTL